MVRNSSMENTIWLGYSVYFAYFVIWVLWMLCLDCLVGCTKPLDNSKPQKETKVMVEEYRNAKDVKLMKGAKK